MIKLRHALVLSLASLALAGCGEREQHVSQGTAKKSDSKVWQGAQATSFTAPGWKAGDKDSWEAQMRMRTQQGQNEYMRAAATSGAAKP